MEKVMGDSFRNFGHFGETCRVCTVGAGSGICQKAARRRKTPGSAQGKGPQQAISAPARSMGWVSRRLGACVDLQAQFLVFGPPKRGGRATTGRATTFLKFFVEKSAETRGEAPGRRGNTPGGRMVVWKGLGRPGEQFQIFGCRPILKF